MTVGMWESPERFPRSAGKAENSLIAFRAFHEPSVPRPVSGAARTEWEMQINKDTGLAGRFADSQSFPYTETA